MGFLAEERRRGGLILALLFIVAGLVGGLILASHFGWTPFGQARVEVPPHVTEQLVQTGQAFTEIARVVTPAVVNISTTRVVKSPGGEPLSPFFNDPFFRDFFGDEFFRRFRIPKERREQSLGSGVIVTQDGYIVTNNHVIEKATEIKVVLSDKREFKGKVVGVDTKTDVAVIKIDAKEPPTIPWGDSDKLQVGEYVLAVGNPFGLTNTVTMGIISAVGRANVGIAEYEDFIQTDAAINPGNSGGALVNIKGELIGINTAIFSRSGGYQGIGFAVPANMVKAVMESLVKEGKVVRGWLGVSIQEMTTDLAKQFGVKDLKGALVGDVVEGSPAEKAGIRRGDVIVEYNGKIIENVSHLRNMVAQTPIGTKSKIKLVRDKKEQEIEVIIGELPKEVEKAESLPGEQVEGENVALEGIAVQDLTSEIAQELGLSKAIKGVVISGIDSGSLAEEAGLREGDVIQEMNREPIKGLKDYNRVVSKLKSDEVVLLLINRGERTLFVTISPAG